MTQHDRYDESSDSTIVTGAVVECTMNDGKRYRFKLLDNADEPVRLEVLIGYSTPEVRLHHPDVVMSRHSNVVRTKLALVGKHYQVDLVTT